MVADDLVAFERNLAVGALEPLRKPLVQLRAERLRHRRVHDLANEDVPEAIRVLARGRPALGPDELLADEARELLVHVVVGGRRHELGYRIALEHLALDRRALEHDAHATRQRVDTSLEQRLNRGRHGDLGSTQLAHHCEHLLDVQRVAGRRLDDPTAQVLVERRLAEHRVDESLALVVGERIEQERRRVVLAPAPVRPQLEKLRSGDAEQEDRGTAREVGDVLDELDEHGLCPLQVVHDDDLRSSRRSLLEEAAERHTGSPAASRRRRPPGRSAAGRASRRAASR